MRGFAGQLSTKINVAGWLIAGVVISAVCSLPPVPVEAAAVSAKRAATPSKAEAPAQAAPAASTTGTAAKGASGTVAPSSVIATPASAPKASSATEVLKAEEANQALQGQIAKLPALNSIKVNVGQGSAALLAHLNSVLRFYHAGTVPIQKVGEPSDVLYAEQSESEATQIAILAFEGAKNEAVLLAKLSGGANGSVPQNTTTSQTTQQEQSEAGRLNGIRAQAQDRLSALQAQETTLAQQLAKAPASQRAALLDQQQRVQGGIELQQAMVSALSRISTVSASQPESGLLGDIDRLQRSAPELMTRPVQTPAPPVLESLAAARSSGVTTQAPVVFQLLSAMHTIDQQTHALDDLSKQVDQLRAPFVTVLRATIAQGQSLTQQGTTTGAISQAAAAPVANTPGATVTRAQFDQLTNTFQVLSNATLPLSQEEVLLDNARGTLTTWRATIQAEYEDMLRHLLLRVAFIVIALVILAVVNKLLNRAAVKYVADLRRRRQLIVIRRFVIGFLTGLVLIFGFVTQFSSLATFAGFISAGIAVGLQSILLSVAAYFFIVGRYGVRVGDRITVANVTGDVIEVGLVRFYMMELVGTGTELHSTGRVAVFANSILFQTGTPIYKQMPGTEYAWHELTAKLAPTADTPAATNAILDGIKKVYASYSERIEAQHRQVESWMGTALPAPQIESRLQLVEGGLQFAVLFPVEINKAAETDQAIAEEIVSLMKTDGPVKAAVTELPVIKAAVKS